MSLSDDADLDAIFASWDSASLGAHLLTAQYGLSIRGEETGRYPILRMNCQLEGNVVFRDLQFVDLSSEQFAAFRVKDGDLLFNRTNSIELVGRTSVFRSPREAVFASYLIRLTLDQNVWHPEFVNLFMNMPAAQRGLKKLASRGVSQANINASKLRDFLVPKPPIDEQRKIAAVLGKVQAAVAVEGDLVRVVRELKQAALRQLFTRGLRGESQKETEIGPMPHSWNVVPFRTLFQTQLGKMLSPKAKQGEAPLPYLRNKNVQWGRIDVDDVLAMDFDARERAKFVLRPGDLLICEGGILGRCALWRGQLKECYYQKALHRVRPLNDESSNEFLAYWLEHAFAFANVYRLGGASSTIAHLPAEQLLALPIPKPPTAEQREIAALLATLDAKIAHHEARQTLLRELFRTLLHDLLTARRRVTSLDLDHFADVGKMNPPAQA